MRTLVANAVRKKAFRRQIKTYLWTIQLQQQSKGRIVVKVGSNILTRPDGRLDITRMSSLVDQIAALRESGYEVILVTSGAVACGRGEFHTDRDLDSVEQRQLFSAMGQAKLIDQYYTLFREYGIHVGQVLTTKDNFLQQRMYSNQKACMEIMLSNGVIPIVNENDTVCVEELMFTDNDELSGLISKMLGAHTLVLVTNIDGVLTGSPSDPSSVLLREILPDEDLSSYIKTEKSGFGRGGMLSKCATARKMASEGVRVLIVNGKRPDILRDILLEGRDIPHTEFIPESHA